MTNETSSAAERVSATRMRVGLAVLLLTDAAALGAASTPWFRPTAAGHVARRVTAWDHKLVLLGPVFLLAAASVWTVRAVCRRRSAALRRVPKTLCLFAALVLVEAWLAYRDVTHHLVLRSCTGVAGFGVPSCTTTPFEEVPGAHLAPQIGFVLLIATALCAFAAAAFMAPSAGPAARLDSGWTTGFRGLEDRIGRDDL